MADEPFKRIITDQTFIIHTPNVVAVSKGTVVFVENMDTKKLIAGI